MTIQIPTSPTYTDVALPDAPTINIPTLSVDDITEPVFSDPTNSLRNFAYERYASIINSMVDETIVDKFTWGGDDILLNAESDKAQDTVIGELKALQAATMNASAAKGFMFVPGKTRDTMLHNVLGARASLQGAAVGVQGELTSNALQFIGWATQAGVNEIRVAVNENKQIVYANMDAVRSTAQSVIDYYQKQLSTFDQKVAHYRAELSAVDAQYLEKDAAVLNYSAGIAGAKMEIQKDDTLFDEKHAENLGVAINNANTILQADEALLDAELEKQKVLYTHAILSEFLAKIKETHAGLVQNRSDVEIVLTDLDNYKKQASLSEQAARNVLQEIGGETDKLSKYYSAAMSQIQLARAEINKKEATIGESSDRSRLLSENYRNALRNTVNATEITDLDTISNNNVNLGEWISSVEASFRQKKSQSDANRTGNTSALSGGYQGARAETQGCAKLNAATFTATGNTTMQLIHNISG